MPPLPKQFERFRRETPEIAQAYEKLGQSVHAAGPLEERIRCLVKLGVSIGSLREGAVHSHTRKALEAGCRPEEIRHAAYLSLPTIGFPAMMAALSWVNDILDKK